jgi:hypothetical protein
MNIGPGITIGNGITISGSPASTGGGGTTYTLTVDTDYSIGYWIGGTKSGDILSFDVQSYPATQSLLDTIPVGTVMTITDNNLPPTFYTTTTTSVFTLQGSFFTATVDAFTGPSNPVILGSISFTE